MGHRLGVRLEGQAGPGHSICGWGLGVSGETGSGLGMDPNGKQKSQDGLQSGQWWPGTGMQAGQPESRSVLEQREGGRLGGPEQGLEGGDRQKARLKSS